MIWIEDKIISDDVIKEYFACNLSACKGACCWEGDYGAPLENEEVEVLNRILEDLRPWLSEKGLQAIDSQGPATWYEEAQEFGTTLIDNQACAFLTFNEAGQAQCGIEKAWEEGAVDFRKPVSCHLYPIRTTRNQATGLEFVNYDRWDICSEACSRGEREKIPLYLFARDSLVRKYGLSFYEQLEAAAAELD